MSAEEWRGRTLTDRDGREIGRIDDVYVDPETGRAEWARVGSAVVPLAGAAPRRSRVVAPVAAAQVEAAPPIRATDELTAEDEARLFRHYGIHYRPDHVPRTEEERP